MNISQMNYVVVLSEELSIRKASERLYISASALSQSLTKIETELGYPVFLRNSSPLIITPEGLQFVECCRKILELYKNSRQSIENNLRGRRKRISLGISTERTSLLLSYCYPEFKQKFPGYTLIQQEGFFNTHPAMVEEGIIDIALTPLPINGTSSQHPSLHYECIGSEELVLYCSPDNPLAVSYQSDPTPVSWNILQGQPFIHQGKTKYTRQILDSYFDKKGIYPSVVMELNNTDICIQFAEVGSGVTIAPKSFAYKHPNVAVIPMDKPLVWTLSLLYHKNKVFSEPEKYICDCIKDICDPEIDIFA